MLGNQSFDEYEARKEIDALQLLYSNTMDQLRILGVQLMRGRFVHLVREEERLLRVMDMTEIELKKCKTKLSQNLQKDEEDYQKKQRAKIENWMFKEDD